MKIMTRLYVILLLISGILTSAQYKNTDIEGVYNKGGVSFILKKTIHFLLLLWVH